MSDVSKRQVETVPVVQRLVRETGITEQQARELVVFLGTNWSSLVREARLIRKQTQRSA